MILMLSCACAVLSAGAGVAVQEEVKLQVPLQYVAFKDLPEMIRFAGAGALGSINQAPVTPAYVLPKSLTGSRAVALRLDGFEKPVLAVMVVPPAKPSPKTVRNYAPRIYQELWLDLNGDRKFEAAEKFKAKTVGAVRLFGPIAGKDDDGNATPEYYICSRYGYDAAAIPAGYYLGKAELGAKTVLFGLVDANNNGMLGERISSYGYGEAAGDILLADFDGDGHFDVTSDESGSQDPGAEIRTISWMNQMPDRGFYHLRVANDLSSVTLTRGDEPMGMVTAKCSKMALALNGPDGLLATYPQESPLALPPGAYRIQQAAFLATDAAGKDWTVTISPGQALSPVLRVKSDETVALKCGGPLKIGFDASHSYDGYYFSLPMTDSFGNDVSGLSKPGGQQPKEPKFKIVDSAGKTIASGAFSYG